MNTAMVASLLIASSAMTVAAQEAPDKEALRSVVINHIPPYNGYAKPAVESIDVDNAKKVVTLNLTESATYIPFDAESLDALKRDLSASLPQACSGYKIRLMADGRDLDQLVAYYPKTYVRPTEKAVFVSYPEREKAPKGLQGNNIALWQSHGRYFVQGNNEWGWQRPRLYQTCEDLFTQSFVMPFLMPMLENAGAYVMSPRERDVHVQEYIIDNDNKDALYTETVEWCATDKPGFAYDGGELLTGFNPFASGTARLTQAVRGDKAQDVAAAWSADIETPGSYAVYVSYQTLPNSVTDAQYTINAADGPHKVVVNQKMGGGTWVYLGHYPFNSGKAELPLVTVSNRSDKKGVITADAVKIGGGMGNIARTPSSPADDKVTYKPMTSGYPRFTEGSRYWLQWAGAPDSVYTPSANQNDYNDDYRSRGLWVNWLAGGSSVLPKQKGLNIPIDLSFAFHSDAGITPNDSVIGTLGIYFTDGKDKYTNGTSRLAARDLTNAVMTNIVDDVRSTFNPKWMRRGMWDKNYAEARVPQVPTMLLELLSHQNFADMQYGLDPAFRFTVSRAIYKGMLEFLAHRDGRNFVVQPLPVQNMALTGGNDGAYRLSWAERVDKLEPTATPTYYIIEERIGDEAGFRQIAKVETNNYDIIVSDNNIHSYRVIAGNDGGRSFPSEVLALRYMPGAKQVMVVNGFTRVSAPDWFDYGEAAGFADRRDPGVPYIQDISFVGEQFEFRRDVSWSKNESAGMGASRSDYEDKVIAGNTFDFVYVHGVSIANAGYGFISSSVDAFISDGTDAPIVDLVLGNQKEITTGSGYYGSRYKTFTAPLQQRLADYTAGGGNLMVTGAFIATDLWNNPFSDEATAKADQEFANKVLGYTWRCGSADPGDKVTGVASPYSMFDDIAFTYHDDRNDVCYGAVSVDAIAPASEQAIPIMKYAHTDFTAATALQAINHKVVAIGVPFETIENASERDAVMAGILKFLK